MGTTFATMSKGERRRLERRKEALKTEGECLPTGEAQPHDEHDVQQRAVREEMLLAGAVFSIPSKQRNPRSALECTHLVQFIM